MLKIFLLAIQCTFVFAKEVNINDLTSIQNNMKNFSQLKLSFQQTIYKDLRKKTRTGNGHAFFKKPNKIRWVIEKPKNEEWVYNGTELYHVIPQSKEAIKYSNIIGQGKELEEIIDMVLNFESLLKKYNLLSAVEKTPDTIQISISPKENREIQSAEVTLNKKTNTVESIKLLYRGNNHTTYVFSNYDFSAIDANNFIISKEIKISSGI